MALGGGTWISQNKVLPGSYINVVGVKTATSALSERGIVALPMVLDFGKDGEVIELTSADFQKDSLKILGYDYSADEMKALRDIFVYAKKVLVYKICAGTTKASNKYAEAKYYGVRYNDIKIVVKATTDSKYIVETLLGETLVDTQTVATAAELVDNDFVVFKKDATLEATAGEALAGADKGSVTTAQYQNALDAFESYSFNALAYAGEDETIKSLIVAYAKRLRDEVGMKFQAVLYNVEANYEGVVNVASEAVEEVGGLVYWVAGVIGGIAVNKSATNLKYTGEYTVKTTLTQSELEDAITAGKFVMNKVSGEYRVLKDINSLVDVTDEKTSDFKMNQVIRVVDQIANDVATLFNTRYLGRVQNNATGRDGFWADLVLYGQDLAQKQAIEAQDPATDIIVEAGDTKESVLCTFNVTVICAMEKLYMTIYAH